MVVRSSLGSLGRLGCLFYVPNIFRREFILHLSAALLNFFLRQAHLKVTLEKRTIDMPASEQPALYTQVSRNGTF